MLQNNVKALILLKRRSSEISLKYSEKELEQLPCLESFVRMSDDDDDLV